MSENLLVKICGITSESDALLAVSLGATAVGFVFAPSPRQVSVHVAGDVAKRLPEHVLTVGVFRDEAPERVVEAARKALITAGTRARTHCVCSADSCPCSWAAPRPAARTASTTRWGASSRNTPTVSTCSGSRLATSPARCTETWRGEGANTKPTADAPRLTASSASASEVMPQILTRRSPLIAP